MPKEIISSRQIIASIIAFIVGSSVILGVNSELAQDSWIALIIATILIIPLILIYARIIKLYPGKDFCQIVELLLGKILSKIIIILFIWYAMHLGALVLKFFSEFTKISALFNTPEIIILMTMTIVTVYLSKSGIEVLGRWSIIVCTIICFLLILTIIFSIPNMDFNNFFPIMNHDLKEILKSSFDIFSFPFAEIVLFLSMASSYSQKNNPYKIYLYGCLLGSIFLLSVIIRNVSILGVPLVKSEYFPSYTATRLINIGDFLTRIEGTITINFIFVGLTKTAVCLIAASKGFTFLFNLKDYKIMIIPISLLILMLATIMYNNVIEMFEFIPIYSIYAIPFQIIIPIIVWIVAEIKNKKE